MNSIDDTYEPRLLREMDERNIRLRAVWIAKAQYRMHYGDFRGELTGMEIDERYARKARLAKHVRNKVKADMRNHKFQKELEGRKNRPENVVSIFHRKQAG